ncbi:hypothetical protein GCM10009715_35860 [Paeniglutamicibacter psychrophenolicus]
MPGASSVESDPSRPPAASAMGVPPSAPLPMKAPAMAANTAAAQMIRLAMDAGGVDCMDSVSFASGKNALNRAAILDKPYLVNR